MTKQQLFFKLYKVIDIWAILRFYPSGGGCSDFSEIKSGKFNGWGDETKPVENELETPTAVVHEENYPNPGEVVDIFQKILAELKQINENTKPASEVIETITTQTTTTITKSTKKKQ